MKPVHIEDKPSFTVIGKLGQGPASEGAKWVPALWEEANQNFKEIKDLAQTDEAGNIVGIWGAMSDISESFARWGEEGKYLAGCEVVDGSEAPAGWTKWFIPSYRYAVIPCDQSNYQDKFNYMIDEFLPHNNYTLAGAVHEFYNPAEANGELYLYFPIEKNSRELILASS